MYITKYEFETWKKLVNEELVRIVGTTSGGLPEWDYRDAWQCGYTPRRAAEVAVIAAKKVGVTV